MWRPRITPIFVLEGPPGAGKSYGIKLIKDHFTKQGIDIGTIAEPVELFERFEYEEHLYRPFELFARDPNGAALSVQHHTNTCLERHFTEQMNYYATTKPQFIVSDRYVDSSQVFSLALHKLNYISTFDLDVLNDRVNSFKQLHTIPQPSIRFFLNTPVDLCAERIQRRSREGESSFTGKSYLQVVHDCHQVVYGNNDNYERVNNIQEVIRRIESHQAMLSLTRYHSLPTCIII